MENLIQQDILKIPISVLKILLKDRSTKKNIIWATNTYKNQKITITNPDFSEENTKTITLDINPEDEIKVEEILNVELELIKPRFLKSKIAQAGRTKNKAEVFTPSWLCNKMNNYLDEEWFGRENIFNEEFEDHTWKNKRGRIGFPDKSWEDYISSTKLEITCGEAPYIVSRYDTTTGEYLKISRRIGILDRKLRIVKEHTKDKEEWLDYAIKAFKSTYGYEYQGDNLLIARINVFMSFIEHYEYKFKINDISLDILKKVAEIISWNFWQMDGIKEIALDGSVIKIKNWDRVRCIDFKSLKDKSSDKEKRKENKNMKFDFAIGNPPYQQMDGGAQSSAVPVYHYFVKGCEDIATCIELIMPARWMTGGKGLDNFRMSLLQNTSIKVIEDFANPKDVFQNVDVKGGICILLEDKNYNGTCRVIRHDCWGINESNRYLAESGESIFIRQNELIPIKNKVWQNKQESFAGIVSARKPYGLAADTMRNASKYGLPEFSNEPIKNGYRILGLGEKQQRTYKYLPKDYPFPKKGALDKYKVHIAEAYGCGELGEIPSTPVLSTPVLSTPDECCTETFLEIGSFETKEEAANCIKYIKTNFFRALVGIAKQTQHTTQKVYKYVPLQNFTDKSDINWILAVDDIDKQLYKKYNLSEEDIAFIEKAVKKWED